MHLSYLLLKWYQNNKRNLPWRNTTNPYHIWISEIILQQTRINQGMDYYNNFINTFPDIQSLANADEEQVLKLWQGLGYYSRARNLHFAAKQIINNFNGIFPNEYDKILSLKGIGEYSAGAIASISFDLAFPAIDGNVQRLISRLYGIEDAINSKDGKNKIKGIVNELIDKNNPGDFNQSLIELGALICKPQKPECEKCPIADYCYSFKNHKQNEFPRKIKLKKPKDRLLYYLFINQQNTYTYICKRDKNDIWKNLYDFPQINIKDDNKNESNLIDEIKKILNNDEFIVKKIHPFIKHQLTHQTIYTCFTEVYIDSNIKLKDSIKITLNDINKYPFPKLIENFIFNINI